MCQSWNENFYMFKCSFGQLKIKEILFPKKNERFLKNLNRKGLSPFFDKIQLMKSRFWKNISQKVEIRTFICLSLISDNSLSKKSHFLRKVKDF